MEIKVDIAKHYGLTEKDLEHTLKSYVPEKVKANHFFLKEGSISDKIGFVKNGILRAFIYNDFANEITTQFFPSGSLIISFESFNNQAPSKENVVAIEDAELMTISFQRQKELYELVPVWNQICKDLADQKSKEMIARSVQFQTMSATERYQKFCKQNPEIIKKVALRHIASYLGIDVATLSRIRNKI